MHRLTLAVLLSLHSLTFSNQEFNVVGQLTPHFQQWLSKNGYDDEEFIRADHIYCYGGKADYEQKITKTPAIFIYGNSDADFGQGNERNDVIGWKNLIECFHKKGYTSAELYAISVGDSNTSHESTRAHDCATILRLRKFLEAVIAYTGAKQVSLVTNSMGLTLGRKVVKGGKIQVNDDNCDVGVPIRIVDVVASLSDANYGLCSSEGTFAGEPTSNEQTYVTSSDIERKEPTVDDKYDWVNIWSI